MSEETLTAVETAMQTAFNGVKTDVISMSTLALPAGLGIMGFYMAIRLCIGFFRSIAH